MGRIRIPIRLKILTVLLVVVTAVVGAITYTMANLFHRDKMTYINSLVSVTATSIAEECGSVLGGYAERLQVHARIASDDRLSAEQKRSLLEGLFQDFPELIAVFVLEHGKELAGVLNAADLEAAGVTPQEVRALRDQPPAEPAGAAGRGVVVRNATLRPQLPAFLIAVPLGGPDDPARRSVVGLVRLDALQSIALRESPFDVALADSSDVVLVDADSMRVYRRDPARDWIPREQWSSQLRAVNREFVDGKGVATIAGFARVEDAGITVRVAVPRTAAFLVTRDILWQLVLVALSLLVSATLVALLWARKITRPMESLSGATREIGKGDFDFQIDIRSRDEIGQLAVSFNQMVSELKQRESLLEAAHGQLIQSEKMAAFGQLGAGIAHEVKNPLAGILGCAQLSLRKAEAGSLVHANLKLIEKETKRCKAIIENLLRFARQEKAAFESVALNQAVEDAAAIVNHQLELNKVSLEKELWPDLPPVFGNSNQLQQVLMNLFINAQQAMEGQPGSLHVSTRPLDAGRVEVRVRDTGPGMTPEVQQRLFEPFFTTKPGGKGTGLGLSVSFGIVKEHRGEIRVESSPGAGACFVITLPVLDEAAVRRQIEEAAVATPA